MRIAAARAAEEEARAEDTVEDGAAGGKEREQEQGFGDPRAMLLRQRNAAVFRSLAASEAVRSFSAFTYSQSR